MSLLQRFYNIGVCRIFSYLTVHYTPCVPLSRNAVTWFQKSHRVSLFIITWRRPYFYFHVTEMLSLVEKAALVLQCHCQVTSFYRCVFAFQRSKDVSSRQRNHGGFCHTIIMLSGGCSDYVIPVTGLKHCQIIEKTSLHSLHQKNVPLAL